MNTGKIKFFNEVKGFGFITSDTEGEAEVFFHFTAMKGGKKVSKEDKGRAVSYELKDGKKGDEADNVEFAGK